MMAGGGVVLFIAYVQVAGTQGAACVGPLQAANPLSVADTVQRLCPQAARLLFLPHPRRSCDSHMVSLPSLISENLKGHGKNPRHNQGSCKVIWWQYSCPTKLLICQFYCS